MALAPSEMDPRDVNQFNKIMLLNGIANQIAAYAVKCGNATFMDYVDMNCGAIPEGPLQQIIDLASPYEFLSMYMQIAEKRFAFAVSGLLKMNPEYMNQLLDFCGRVGKDMDLPVVEDIEAALSVYDSFILDGMPDQDTKILEFKSDKKIVWRKIKDTHESSWTAAEGDLNNYYKLLESFVAGLFVKSGLTLTIEDKTTFCLAFN